MATIKKIVTAADKHMPILLEQQKRKMYQNAKDILKKPKLTQEDINQLVMLIAKIVLEVDE